MIFALKIMGSEAITCNNIMTDDSLLDEAIKEENLEGVAGSNSRGGTRSSQEYGFRFSGIRI
jgi:hypothetical protein